LLRATRVRADPAVGNGFAFLSAQKQNAAVEADAEPSRRLLRRFEPFSAAGWAVVQFGLVEPIG